MKVKSLLVIGAVLGMACVSSAANTAVLKFQAFPNEGGVHSYKCTEHPYDPDDTNPNGWVPTKPGEDVPEGKNWIERNDMSYVQYYYFAKDGVTKTDGGYTLDWSKFVFDTIWRNTSANVDGSITDPVLLTAIGNEWLSEDTVKDFTHVNSAGLDAVKVGDAFTVVAVSAEGAGPMVSMFNDNKDKVRFTQEIGTTEERNGVWITTGTVGSDGDALTFISTDPAPTTGSEQALVSNWMEGVSFTHVQSIPEPTSGLLLLLGVAGLALKRKRA